jgi:hypothetical protein
VTITEPLPAPSQENPYATGGRCLADPQTDARPVVPAPELQTTDRPTKAEYARAFAADGPLPACVVDTIESVFMIIKSVREWFDGAKVSTPRRLRKAIERFDPMDLASVYDAGTLARIRHYHSAHWVREYRARLRA